MNQYGTILIVDDNQAILTALRYCLESTFERIICLEQPDDILKTMVQENVDIVLLDMNYQTDTFNGQEGLEWLCTIRKQHPQIPVVLLTAYGDIPLAVNGMKSGAADFITKPWDNDDLIRKLTNVLNLRDEIVTLDKMEQKHILHTIDRCHGNLTQAADLLGITRQTLYNKMKRFV